MKILVISDYFPDDPDIYVHGVYQRLGIWIEALGGVGEVDVLFFAPSSVDDSAVFNESLAAKLSERWHTPVRLKLVPRIDRLTPRNIWHLATASLRACFAGSFSFFYKSLPVPLNTGPDQLRALDAALAAECDLIFAHRQSAMCPLLVRPDIETPIVLDLDDVEITKLRQRLAETKGLKSLALKVLARILLYCERKAVARATLVTVSAPSDLDVCAAEFLGTNIEVVPNAVPIRTCLPQSNEPTMLFIGSYNYLPNVEAACLLTEHIWPRIRGELPDARLLIAGWPPGKLPFAQSPAPGVSVLGFVNNLDDLYKRVRVVACPLHVVGGTRIKILEAAAFGRPVVTTSSGASGLPLTDGIHALVRDDAAEFASACVELLVDQEKARSIGQAAFELVRHEFVRDSVILRIREMIGDVLAVSRTPD